MLVIGYSLIKAPLEADDGPEVRHQPFMWLQTPSLAPYVFLSFSPVCIFLAAQCDADIPPS